MKTTTVQFNNVEAGYNGRKVLKSLSGEIPGSERIALIGPNGCGKSTLLRVLMGTHPSTGSIKLSEQEISQTDPMERNRLGIGCMRQGMNIFPSLTGLGNLEIAFSGRDTALYDRVEEVVAFLPIVKDCLNRRAGLLSGGMRQSLALAMVLMNRPKVLLLDEPLAGLSPKAATELMSCLQNIHGAEGISWLIVEHRLPLIQQGVNCVWIMRDGELIHKTDDVSILKDPDGLAEHFQLS